MKIIIIALLSISIIYLNVRQVALGSFDYLLECSPGGTRVVLRLRVVLTGSRVRRQQSVRVTVPLQHHEHAVGTASNDSRYQCSGIERE